MTVISLNRRLSSFPARPAPANIDTEPMGAMNTTPLIDVMLVLLIMFIITIPPPTHKVDVPVPGPAKGVVANPVVNRLTIDPIGVMRWNGAPIDLLTLRATLAETRNFFPEPELQLRPDAEAPYVKVDEALAVIRRSGVEKLGFVGNEGFGRF